MFLLKIKDLQATTTLGVYDWEKQAPRQVILNIDLSVAAGMAGTSDDLKDAVDYATLETSVLAHLDRASYQLLETLVTDVAKLLLSLDARIRHVRVEADKPGALRMARSVSVTTELSQG
jgi:dihydroneopterin aldolase